MADYYYQIKARRDSGYGMSSWAWPPVFSGKVSAKNRKQAKQLIEDEYDREFPLRVLKKDIEQHNYLLGIREITEEDERTRSLFDLRECKQCKNTYRQIDLYNDFNERYKGSDYCGKTCGEKYEQEHRSERLDSQLGGVEQPVIYQVKNIKTDKSYIGKTTQVFTLRWYQHFYQGGSCKFHQAIKESPLEDWEFRVVESIIIPDGSDKDVFVSEREKFWINKLNAVENGYNSLSS